MLVNKLLADANRLKVHAEDAGHGRGGGAVVVFAVDLVEDGHHLEAVIALDVLEAPGIVIARATALLVRQKRLTVEGKRG